MNSEELEQSLRTEFEGYLKDVLADMKQEVSQFHQKVDRELEKHKSHLDEVFQEFSGRIQTERQLDEGFKESVVEHLRLARDEGARITATAIAEAEEFTKAEKKEKQLEAPSVALGDIRDAVHDISSQNSQSDILKALINHAAKFTPRGAFFVVKNQHFVGWRVFGKQENAEDGSITETVFPISASTILGESVRSLSVVESAYGSFSDDADYLKQLEFGKPEKMFAVPLIARGRGVAAIYADNGDETENVNIEALETLVSVAGLTVELLAAAQSSNYTREPVRAASYAASEAAAATESREESHVSEVSDTAAGYKEEADADYEEAVEEAETSSEETPAEFADDRSEEVEEPVSSYYREPEASGADETPGEDDYAPADSGIHEVEVEESETEDISYQEPTGETGYEVSDEVQTSFEASETDDQPATEIVVEETYSFTTVEISAEEESAEPDYAVYDDDLIEEVQAQTEEPSYAEEVDAVYDDESASEVQSPAEAEAETAEAGQEEESPVWSQPDDTIEEVSDSYSTEQTALQSDSVMESIDPAQEEYSESSAIDYPEFETNQDFNSSPVQFEESAKPFEEAAFNYSQPVSEEEAPEETVEEVSFTDSQAAETAEAGEKEEETVAEEPAQYTEPVATTPIRTRFSERNVDLPIEVSEEERRLHNDARRFARLLVSEIKLYNEQKVKEGRESSDLYERLREAIDRSREMYDKRVQPAVVDRFDYFHFEVVNTLAEGEESKLGSSYPGATV